MKNLLKIEEFAMLLLSIFLFSLLDLQWWWYLVFFLAPDLGFLGYAVNAKVGAFTYNVLHHKGIAIMIYLLGVYLGNQTTQFTGILIFGHASFDRLLGYGLKYNDSFHNTHLGKLVKKND